MSEPTEDAAHEAAVVMVRTWLDRHPRPIYGDDTWWSDWAARNFLADPEVREHVTLVASRRAKCNAVRALHIRDQDGGTDREHWVCQECDRAWPCDTVKLIDGVAG